MMCTAAVCPYIGEARSGCYDKTAPDATPQEPHHQPQVKWREMTAAYTQDRRLSPITLSPLSASGLARLSHSFARLAHAPQRPLKTFDTLSFLPPEISIQILSYLGPQDLCRICLVCKRWYEFAQDNNLKRKRTLFVNELREHYQQAKENFNNGSETPPQNNYTRRHSTPVLSPLNVARDVPGAQQRHGNQSLLSPSHHAPRPSITNMTDSVEKLSLAADTDIRRCLFPLYDPPRSKRPDLDPPSVNRSPRVSSRSNTEIIGKRSKGRLRRL